MRLLIAALAILAATSARAQDVPIVQAGADGRFERQIDAKTRSDGFGPGEVAAFRGMASGAFAADVPHGWTQGSRPASSSAMILPVMSS